MDSNSEPTMVRTERDDRVLRLTLQNAPANLLSIALMRSLQAELDAAERDPAIRVVVVAAAGTLFSAGHDLKELTAHRSDADRGMAFFRQTFALCSRLMQSIVNFPKPVIAEVDGVATAAGCQLVASCDLAVASPRAQFGVNGINLGLFCTSPAVALTRVVNRKRAMEMLLTGEMISAAAALEAGLVNRVVERESLKDNVSELARSIAAKSPTAVRLGKQGVTRQVGMNLSRAYDEASRVMVENLMTTDAEAGIGAFLDHREPRFEAG